MEEFVSELELYTSQHFRTNQNSLDWTAQSTPPRQLTGNYSDSRLNSKTAHAVGKLVGVVISIGLLLLLDKQQHLKRMSVPAPATLPPLGRWALPSKESSEWPGKSCCGAKLPPPHRERDGSG
ncbi:unnamed protein product [Polarella glacialis]|uniref:Uncharacterized protein n=1 Tax=Polarella glacialis TaxID=89957 RepID=A0A813ENC9_POLGL|nr:unnamed protein product [Polarella glacialis]